MKTSFWNQLTVSGDTGVQAIKIPPAVRIQSGEPGVYPWAEKCRGQLEELGDRALAKRRSSRASSSLTAVTRAEILMVAAQLQNLARGDPADMQPIEFRARRLPRNGGAMP